MPLHFLRPGEMKIAGEADDATNAAAKTPRHHFPAGGSASHRLLLYHFPAGGSTSPRPPNVVGEATVVPLRFLCPGEKRIAGEADDDLCYNRVSSAANPTNHR